MKISKVALTTLLSNWLFPVQRGYWSGETLEQLRLTYYNNIDSDETVAIVNHLHDAAASGQQIFSDIYTEAVFCLL